MVGAGGAAASFPLSGLTELWPLFQEAPACFVGPAAASPGSSSVWRPPGSAARPDWMEKNGKSAGKGGSKSSPSSAGL